MPVSIAPMSAAEKRSGGAGLRINHSFEENRFGKLLIASTPQGIAYLAFGSDEDEMVVDLKKRFPKADLHPQSDWLQQQALKALETGVDATIPLHLKGTPFQLRVWEALAAIPYGKLVTYSDIAAKIGSPRSHRAVGTAVGDNPVAYLIPCHRVIKSTGEYGEYRWGAERKQAMIAYELAAA